MLMEVVVMGIMMLILMMLMVLMMLMERGVMMIWK